METHCDGQMGFESQEGDSKGVVGLFWNNEYYNAGKYKKTGSHFHAVSPGGTNCKVSRMFENRYISAPLPSFKAEVGEHVCMNRCS